MTIGPRSQSLANTNHYESQNKSQKTNKKLSVPFTIVSGTIVAAIELITLGHICDRIKTHQQANPRVRTIHQAAMEIFGTNGFRGFYTGLKWNLFTHCGKSSFRWMNMSLLDDFFHKTIPEDLKKKHPTLQPTSLSISLSLIESFLLICPAESFKTKEMTSSQINAFKVAQWIKNKGFRSMYDGWDAVVTRQAISWYSFLVSYSVIQRKASELKGGVKLHLWEQFSVAAAAGGINVICTTPIDTIKTQMQMLDPLKKTSIFSAIPAFYKENGIKGFYSGFSIRMIRSTWYAGITLTLMEKLGIIRSHPA